MFSSHTHTLTHTRTAFTTCLSACIQFPPSSWERSQRRGTWTRRARSSKASADSSAPPSSSRPSWKVNFNDRDFPSSPPFSYTCWFKCLSPPDILWFRVFVSPSSVHRRRGVERREVLPAGRSVADSRQIPTCRTFWLQQASLLGLRTRRLLSPWLDLHLSSIPSHICAKTPPLSTCRAERRRAGLISFFSLAKVGLFLF